MKLLFICSSLESGRDGVGDYTQILAEECARLGHTTRLLAIHDTHLRDNTPLHTDTTAASPDTLRLPSSQPWPLRATIAAEWIRNYAPDWQSWQLVPYGLHINGIISSDARAAASLIARGPWRRHVMLHELWLGLSQHEPLRHRITGSLQRRALMKFLTTLAAVALDTTNPTYLTVLIRNDLAASHLPLFGNIPVISVPPANSNSKTPNASVVSTATTTPAAYHGIIFGTIHPQFLSIARETIAVLLAGARASARPLRITVAGNTGASATALHEILLNFAPNSQFQFSILGEFPPEKISLLLQSAHFGIATHPWALLGKSGAVAAMLDHGMPVVVPRDDWTLRGRAAAPFTGYWPYSSGLVRRLAEMPPEHLAGWLALRRAPAPRAPEIAAQFLERLHAATATPALEMDTLNA